MRIRDRYQFANQLTPCRIIVPKIGVDGSMASDVKMLLKSHILASPLVNFSVSYTDTLTIGHATAHGNYTGLLGAISRDEADTAFQLVRPASLKYDLVRIGPAVMPTDLIAMASKGKTVKFDFDVSDVLYNGDLTTMSLFLIAVFMVASVLAFSRRNVKDFASSCLRSTWNTLTTLVDQENYAVKSWWARILWLHYNLAIFVIVFGYIVNQISADEVVEKPPRRIDSVKDLFDPHFDKTKLMMSRNLFFYDYIITAKPQSRLGILFKRMSETSDCSKVDTCNFMDFKASDMPSMMTTLSKGIRAVESADSALLVDQNLSHRLGTMFGCSVFQDVLRGVQWTRDSLVSDYAAMFFSKKTGKHTLEYVSGRVIIASEAGLPYRQLQGFMKKILPMGHSDGQTKCMYPAWGVLELDSKQFKLKLFTKTFKVYLSMMAFALCILIAESILFSNRFYKRTKKMVRGAKKSRTRQQRAMSLPG
ncbi:hypothetical protein HDE_11462 [Halotydeus destructor]|nr:hypothetical protein HDE_11462 [Halotydeus destructor]